MKDNTDRNMYPFIGRVFLAGELNHFYHNNTEEKKNYELLCNLENTLFYKTIHVWYCETQLTPVLALFIFIALLAKSSPRIKARLIKKRKKSLPPS